MILKKINITNFRNYNSLELELYDGINIIYGNNAQGKTNLLESIYVLAMTKSHRSFIDQTLIKQDKDTATIKGLLQQDDIIFELELGLQIKNKKLKIDHHIIKKVSDYISKMNIIIFYPEDLDLIKGSPLVRRRFMNTELSQLYSQYYIILNDYSKLLKIRNDYLKKISKNEIIDENYFTILTKYFIDKAVLLYKMRKKFVDKINSFCELIYYDISGLHGFYIKYVPTTSFESYEIDYLKKTVEEKLESLSIAERKVGSTLVGPHRDDFEFYVENNNLKNYGSQGQQRMAILALKLSELKLFQQTTGQNPILLLDDVFSELDDNKKNNLLSYINNKIQTIITTTDLENINSSIVKQSKLIKINNGDIAKIEEVEKYGRE